MHHDESWRQVTWGDLATLEYGKGLRSYQEQKSTYPVYGTNGQIGWCDVALCKKPGIIIGRKGAYRGVHLSKTPFFVIDTAFYLNVLSNEVDLIWAYYQLINFDINKIDSGSAIPSTSREAFYQIPVLLPPLPIQRKIASILSDYDDLIENNTRRIALLEEMAQSLYREWFVYFRFPGHEKNTKVESPLGIIPEGWEVKTFGEVALNFDSKRKPLSSLQRAKIQGIYPYYGAAKIFDHINSYLFDGKYLLVAEDGSVITEERKPVLQMVTGKFWPNNHTHIIQGKQPVSTDFLYLFMKELDISGYVTGAAQPKITQSNLNRIPLIVPTESLLKLFDEQVGTFLLLIKGLETKNATLRRTRDLLLPKLISGELDVEGLNIEVGGDVEDANGVEPVLMEEARDAVEAIRQDAFTW